MRRWLLTTSAFALIAGPIHAETLTATPLPIGTTTGTVPDAALNAAAISAAQSAAIGGAIRLADHGGYCDGAHDDTSAINATASAYPGRRILLGPGIYCTITAPLVFTASGTRLEGEPATSITANFTATAGVAAITFTPSVVTGGAQISNVGLRNVQVLANSSSYPGDGVQFVQTVNAFLETSAVSNFKRGLRLTGTSNFWAINSRLYSGAFYGTTIQTGSKLMLIESGYSTVAGARQVSYGTFLTSMSLSSNGGPSAPTIEHGLEITGADGVYIPAGNYIGEAQTNLYIQNESLEASGSCSFATNVMTCSAPTIGAWAVGQGVGSTASGNGGLPAGLTIASLGTGTGGAGTYNLSATVGTITSATVNANPGRYVSNVIAAPFLDGNNLTSTTGFNIAFSPNNPNTSYLRLNFSGIHSTGNSTYAGLLGTGAINTFLMEGALLQGGGGWCLLMNGVSGANVSGACQGTGATSNLATGGIYVTNGALGAIDVHNWTFTNMASGSADVRVDANSSAAVTVSGNANGTSGAVELYLAGTVTHLEAHGFSTVNISPVPEFTTGYAIGSLPTCNAAAAGKTIAVTGSTSGAWQARCNGTNWIAPGGATIS